MKKELKAIIFDVGGVLCKKRMNTVHKLLCREFNLNLSNFYKIRRPYFNLALIGKISGANYLNFIARALKINRKIFIRKYKKLTEKNQIKNKGLVNLLPKLKKHYILGVLTNVTPINNNIRKHNNEYKNFKLKLISYEVGLRKPDARIYKLLIKKLEIKPELIVFIDDEKENIGPAKKLGIKAILFKNNNQLVRDLRKLGVKL